MPSQDGTLMVGLRARRLGRRARSCARSTTPASAVESLNLVQPTLDDVFVEKTGRHLEGAEEQQPGRASRSRA